METAVKGVRNRGDYKKTGYYKTVARLYRCKHLGRGDSVVTTLDSVVTTFCRFFGG
jgi:hypothetical protein